MPSVTVAVITHNRRKILKECLASIFGGTLVPDEVRVYDNASADGTLEMLKEEFPQVKVVENKENFGLSYCHNQALKNFTTDALLLLDDDNEVAPDMLEKLMDKLFSEEKLGIVLPLFMNAYDDPKTVCFCGGETSLWSGRNILRNKNFSKEQETYPTYRVPNATLIKKEAALATGLMDDRLFSTMADEDYCRRMALHGYRAEFLLSAVTDHLQEVKRSDARRLGLTNPLQTYIFARNRAVLVKRYGTLLQLIVFMLFFQPLFHVYYLFNMRRYGAPKSFRKAYWAGIGDSLRYVFGGKLPELSEIRQRFEA
ncbi:glycosyltransferase family 2 protein [bacterium]|nr:glycosyltransferase family 2 protein [bacterium]